MDLVEWIIGLVIGGIVGAFVGVAFFQPLMSGLVPNRVRFLSFRIGKRLRLKKPVVELEAATRIEINTDSPITWGHIERMLHDVLPAYATYDRATRRFAFKEENVHYELTLGFEEPPNEISVSAALGALKPGEVERRLLIAHVHIRQIVDRLNEKDLGSSFKAIDTFSIQGTTSWQPDLIQWVKTAIGGDERATHINMTFTVGSEELPISFADSSIRATGDIGSESFLTRLSSVISLYV